LKTDESTDFYLRDVQTDDLGMTHEKYQQTHNGI
jgi:Zn-dependent metalloprotease